MKKIVLALAIVATLFSMTSCNKDKEQCYKIKYTINDQVVETYMWATGAALDKETARLEALGYVDIKTTPAIKYKTPEDCWDAALSSK